LTIAADILFLAVAYLIGALPHLVFLARLKHLPAEGDLHIALWQQAGAAWGILAIGIDVLKGVLAVSLARWIGFDQWTVALAVMAVTAGQMWPVFHHFDGEKGNTTGFGAALVFAPAPAMIALVPVILAIIGKLVSLLRRRDLPRGEAFKRGAGRSNALPVAVALAFLILPLVAWLDRQPWPVIVGLALLGGLVFIRRLTAGITRDRAADRDGVFWRRLLLDRAG
jgi:glycerol-3-phosphate acyltransferase PlsY